MIIILQVVSPEEEVDAIHAHPVVLQALQEKGLAEIRLGNSTMASWCLDNGKCIHEIELGALLNELLL